MAFSLLLGTLHGKGSLLSGKIPPKSLAIYTCMVLGQADNKLGTSSF